MVCSVRKNKDRDNGNRGVSRLQCPDKETVMCYTVITGTIKKIVLN